MIEYIISTDVSNRGYLHSHMGISVFSCTLLANQLPNVVAHRFTLVLLFLSGRDPVSLFSENVRNYLLAFIEK